MTIDVEFLKKWAKEPVGKGLGKKVLEILKNNKDKAYSSVDLYELLKLHPSSIATALRSIKRIYPNNVKCKIFSEEKGSNKRKYYYWEDDDEKLEREGSYISSENTKIL